MTTNSADTLTADEYLAQVRHLLQGRRGSVYGFRFQLPQHGGGTLLCDVAMWEPTVYGVGATSADAVADCKRRKGVPYPPCCEREYGSHAKGCKGYSQAA